MNDDTYDLLGVLSEKEREEYAARVDAEEAFLREFLTFDDAVSLLAAYRVFAEYSKASMARVREMAQEFSERQVRGVDEISALALKAIDDSEATWAKEVASRAATTNRAKAAADALHNKPGGNREKRDAIRAIWASGKYSSRAICAEQECAGLGMSFDAARKALRNTPDPA